MGIYSASDRWLPCEACGLGIQCPVQGGTTSCSRCGAPFAAHARPDTSIPHSPPSDEGQRLMRLRAQDGKPMLPPEGFQQLIVNSQIPPHKMQEAQMVWSATRKALLGNPGDLGAADRLVWLTMLMRNTLLGTDDTRVRALLEGALEALMLPRHRQGIRGHLARGAVRENDFASADQWLAGCDPNSEDLPADSAFRVSYAFLATARNQPAAVLSMLGAKFEDVPIDDSMDAVATVLRANAWEKQGQVDSARAVLAAYMARGGGAAAVESVVKSSPASWHLCAQSLSGAQQQVRQVVASRASSGAALFGWVFLVAGCIPLVILIGLIASDQFELPMLFMLIFPLTFGGIGLKSIGAARRAKEIAANGLRGRGRILGLTPTGTTVNDVPMIRFDLEITLEGRPSVRASATKLMYPQGNLVGAEIGVIWHPKYPNDAVMEI